MGTMLETHLILVILYLLGPPKNPVGLRSSSKRNNGGLINSAHHSMRQGQPAQKNINELLMEVNSIGYNNIKKWKISLCPRYCMNRSIFETHRQIMLHHAMSIFHLLTQERKTFTDEWSQCTNMAWTRVWSLCISCNPSQTVLRWLIQHFDWIKEDPVVPNANLIWICMVRICLSVKTTLRLSIK